MRLTRVYVEEPLAAGKSCAIGGTAANHIARVLRLREGDALTLFDGRGGEYGARIAGFRKDTVSVDVQEHRAVERESALDLTLAQGISRGERMDWVMQKATELGVRRILPIFTERSVVKLDERQSERKLQHWRAIVIAACEQCGRNRVPEVAPPLNFFEALRESGSGVPQPAASSLSDVVSARASRAATADRADTRVDDVAAHAEEADMRAGDAAAHAEEADMRAGDVAARADEAGARAEALTHARLLLSPSASLRARDLSRSARVTLLIGPEGGLADNEEEAAIRAGFQPVQLGPRILRTETAAIAALAALQHDFGDL